MNEILKSNLRVARNRMKQQADKRRSEREFQVRNWVYLKLQPYKQTSLALRKTLKLSAKSGPLRVVDKDRSCYQ